MNKQFTINPQIGKAKHSISFCNGNKHHKDGSLMYDIAIFKTAKEKEKYRKELIKNQYTEI